MSAPSPLYALAVRWSVDDLDGAAAFCRQALGFELRRREPTLAVLENGALVLHVTTGDERASGPRLELVTHDLESSASLLESFPGVVPLGSVVVRAPEIHERSFRGPFGLELVLVRRFNEDELGVLPELPTALLWQAEVALLLQELLRDVPLAFRADARRRATAEAEALALAGGRIEVGADDAARGLLLATPDFRREEVRRLLERRGVGVPIDEGRSA